MNSIRWRLVLWLLAGLIVGTVLTAVGTYRTAIAEANELADYNLRQLAASFPGQVLTSAQPQRAQEEGEIEESIVFQVWNQEGLELYLSHRGSSLPQRAELGFSNVATPTGLWRVFGLVNRDRVIQVAQPMAVRQELAAQTALRTIRPLLVLIPGFGVLIWFLVGRGLRPLNQVASAVSQRSAASLAALSERKLPAEVKPLVHALNDLLARLGQALESQRAFIADAAHELRTPLAALRLQAELVRRAADDNERERTINRLEEGLSRVTNVVQQLLTLARQDPQAAHRPFAPVSLNELARSVVAEQAPLADEKDIDLGITRDEPVSVTGDAEALRTLLGNLIDNAIRYTPKGGQIDVSIYEDSEDAVLTVADTGPGIPAQERDRVFDRFYRRNVERVEGTGLGLAIVKQIADRHKARVSLSDSSRGTGLIVTIRFTRV